MLGSIHAWRVILLGYPFTLHGWQFCQVYTALFPWFFLFFFPLPLVDCCRISTASVSKKKPKQKDFYNDFGFLSAVVSNQWVVLSCICNSKNQTATTTKKGVECVAIELNWNGFTSSGMLRSCISLALQWDNRNQPVNHCKLFQEDEIQFVMKFGTNLATVMYRLIKIPELFSVLQFTFTYHDANLSWKFQFQCQRIMYRSSAFHILGIGSVHL